MRIPPSLVLSTALAAAPLAAQSADAAAAAQLRMLEHQRTTLLQMVDSMPERLYRDRAAPGQRDFAQQIHHAASAAAFIASRTMGGGALALPDTSAAFAGRAGLRAFVNAAYDYTTGVFRAQTPAARAGEGNLFGRTMPRWQIWDEIHMHTTWTAGQVVANFRKHGMAPPAFSFF